MRIVGLRIDAPVARLLVGLLQDAGFDETAARIAQALELQVTTEAPLTMADYDAILVALGDSCPASLARLRRELLEVERRARRTPT